MTPDNQAPALRSLSGTRKWYTEKQRDDGAAKDRANPLPPINWKILRRLLDDAVFLTEQSVLRAQGVCLSQSAHDAWCQNPGGWQNDWKGLRVMMNDSPYPPHHVTIVWEGEQIP